jgi:hypothetical protein
MLREFYCFPAVCARGSVMTRDGDESSLVNSMRPVDKHGKTSCADDLLFTLMIAGEVYPGLIVCTTDKTFKLYA